MSLRAFHGVFIAACLALLAFTASWATGRNAAGETAPWLFWGSLAGAALMIPYLRWYLKKVRLPR